MWLQVNAMLGLHLCAAVTGRRMGSQAGERVMEKSNLKKPQNYFLMNTDPKTKLLIRKYYSMTPRFLAQESGPLLPITKFPVRSSRTPGPRYYVEALQRDSDSEQYAD